ncbi:MAG: hypothetical protein P1U34_10615 [Coxiellaceae bacterium]|nr:hypothetical protein [Coxiellaceae bacterium]
MRTSNKPELDTTTTNLNRYPGHHQYPVASPHEQINIGDLHGNTLKLIYTLLREGVLYFDCDRETAKKFYQELHDIYDDAAANENNFKPQHKEVNLGINNLDQPKLDRFIEIINHMQLRNVNLVRLIGDELADRGSNDLLTITLLNILKQKGLKSTILFSNHSMEFIRLAIANKRNNITSQPQICSFIAFRYSKIYGLINDEEILSFWHDTYLPQLKLFDYHIDGDSAPPQITIMSHAPAGLETIRSAAARFNVDYQDDSIDQLAKTINVINLRFRQSLQQDDFSCFDEHAFYSEHLRGIEERTSIPPKFPVLRCAWNRKGGKYNKLNIFGYIITDVTDHLEQPGHQHGYRLHFLHGHEGQDTNPTSGNCTNIDNNLGKKARDRDTGRIAPLTGGELPYYIVRKQKFNYFKHPKINNYIESLRALIEARNSLKCQAFINTLSNNTAGLKAHDFKLIIHGLRESITLSGYKKTRALQQKTLEQLSNLQQLRHAKYGGGTEKTISAEYCYQWFENFINQQLGNEQTAAYIPYNPADGHYSYHLHAMLAILQSVDTLEDRRELSDTIAAVDALYNIYQQITDNQTHWWQRRQLPALANHESLPYEKPSYLNRKQQTCVPTQHRSFRRATKTLLEKRITGLDQHSHLSIGQRIKRWWNNLFKKKTTRRRLQLNSKTTTAPQETEPTESNNVETNTSPTTAPARASAAKPYSDKNTTTLFHTKRQIPKPCLADTSHQNTETPHRRCSFP